MRIEDHESNQDSGRSVIDRREDQAAVGSRSIGKVERLEYAIAVQLCLEWGLI